MEKITYNSNCLTAFIDLNMDDVSEVINEFGK